MAELVHGWIGADLSTAELTVARARGPRPLLRASAAWLPVATDAAGAVVCSMAMHVIEPLVPAIAEVARVLRPGGRAVLLLPATRPLTLREAVVYLRAERALRRRIRYPNDRVLAGPQLAATTARCGLTVVADERRRFSLPLQSDAHVSELLDSLYLPGIDARRLQRAHRYLSRRIGAELTVPLRRVVLDAGIAGAPTS